MSAPVARPSPAVVVLHLALAAMFATFSWLQRNDLDPAIYDRPSILDAALWLGFYLLIGAMFVVSLFRRLPPWLLALSIAACAVEMATTAPGLWQNVFGERSFTMTQASMSAEDPRVELTREFFGALIALVAVAWLALRERRRQPAGA